MSESPDLRGRWLWKSMDYAGFTACAVCARQVYCYGKTWERMVCLDCFTADQDSARGRQSGKAGKRAGYQMKTRRPKGEMVRLVAHMRDEERKPVGVIADELGISERTVKNYLSLARKAEKCAASPDGEPSLFTRKEERDLAPILLSGEA